MSFLLQYIFKPLSIGAVMPSSKHLARKMMTGIDFQNADCIVEYGAGTGVFTDEILQLRKPGSVVITFEMNPSFCEELKEKFGKEPNLHIINDSAETIGKELNKLRITNADCIISGLPFASLPKDVSEKILSESIKNLRQGGQFITFQYTLRKKNLIERHFGILEIVREVRNVPPAYVFRCRKSWR